MFTKGALGGFLAGGMLVGGITFAGVAHGVGTETSTSTGQSDAQYTAKHAWAQSFTVNGPAQSFTLSIPADNRLTITSDVVGIGDDVSCTYDTSVNGSGVSYSIQASSDPNPGVFEPIYADAGGTLSCAAAHSFFTLVGYLTPIPAA